MPNRHPLQVDLGVGLLCTFEGFRFVSGWPFPDSPLVVSPLGAGPETASIAPLISAMTFQWAMGLSMFLTVCFNKVGKGPRPIRVRLTVHSRSTWSSKVFRGQKSVGASTTIFSTK